MTEDAMPGSDAPGDPRSIRSRSALLKAAARLLTDGGVAAVTYKRVAAEAGVGRATLYRHWPRQLDLLLDAMEIAVPELELGEGRVRERLIRELKQRIEWFNQPIAGSAIAAMIERSEHEPRNRRLRDSAFGQPIALLSEAIAEAVRKGELSPRTPCDVLAKALVATLLFDRNLLGTHLTADIVETLVDALLQPWSIDE